MVNYRLISLALTTYTQSLPDWLLSHVRMLEFFGCVPEILVPDNLKSGVKKACRYSPDHQQLAEDYQVAVIPARPRKPRDKPKVEVAGGQGARQNRGKPGLSTETVDGQPTRTGLTDPGSVG